MKITILHATMSYTKEDGYVGQVQFRAENHRDDYEITLQSKKGKEWSYGLHFLNASGSEEEIFKMEELIEEDDELFDSLIEAAKISLDEK
ncbi:hypothetical protein [Paenibacillus abyssi]|uniref:Uncharacterized protein n=1 Tax=Paenibacillus abyssi TaxID=1340531 RepID=A0A917FXM0_9BACL|nr:hypothetical protein [Paenibacillus abyssi]GGG11484.1 hypothetical protein GCM10010916_30410 [Paenibacillus abyssi]